MSCIGCVLLLEELIRQAIDASWVTYHNYGKELARGGGLRLAHPAMNGG